MAKAQPKLGTKLVAVFDAAQKVDTPALHSTYDALAATTRAGFGNANITDLTSPKHQNLRQRMWSRLVRGPVTVDEWIDRAQKLKGKVSPAEAEKLEHLIKTLEKNKPALNTLRQTVDTLWKFVNSVCQRKGDGERADRVCEQALTTSHAVHSNGLEAGHVGALREEMGSIRTVDQVEHRLGRITGAAGGVGRVKGKPASTAPANVAKGAGKEGLKEAEVLEKSFLKKHWGKAAVGAAAIAGGSWVLSEMNKRNDETNKQNEIS